MAAINQITVPVNGTNTTYDLKDKRISGVSSSTSSTSTTDVANSAAVKAAYDLAASKSKWANVSVGSSANYITEPEFKSVKINGSSTNSASSSNCVLQYDTTNKCLKFIFN